MSSSPEEPATPTPAHDDHPATNSEPSRHRTTGWILLSILTSLGGWLLWEIQRTVGLSSPHLWTLLREDRVFAFAMLDFFLTAAWAALVLIERADPRDWRNWVALLVFCAIPTLGIILFLLIGRTRPREDAQSTRQTI